MLARYSTTTILDVAIISLLIEKILAKNKCHTMKNQEKSWTYDHHCIQVPEFQDKTRR